jgi:protease-4
MKPRSWLTKIAYFVLLVLAGFFIARLTPPNHSKHLIPPTPIVMLKLEGPIYETLELVEQLEEVGRTPTAKVVVLRIDSPGGVVGPSQEVYTQILRLRKKGIKVVASMGAIATSGAYYAAAACDHVVASSGTITGSIGVIIESFGFQNILNLLQLESRVIKSGTHKDVGSPFREMSEDEKKYLQDFSDELYLTFVKDVAQARKIETETLKNLAQGKIYTGQKALELKLVDELGNFNTALDSAKRLANLPDLAESAWVEAEPSIIDMLRGYKSTAQNVVDSLLLQNHSIFYLLPKFLLRAK